MPVYTASQFLPGPDTGLSAGFSYFSLAPLTSCPVVSNCSITFELRTHPMDKRIFWLALGSFAISTEGFVISSLLPDIASDAGISVPLAGSLITAFALAYAIGAPVLATLTGEWDRRRVILWTLVFFVIGNLVAAVSSSFELLLIARIVMALSSGLFAATAQGTAVALVDDHH
ncbi:MAG: MFS transporter, partial [Mesorhizobium sp.]